MTERYNLVEARANLGDLVIRAQAGEPSVITRYGKPIAMITSAGEQSRTIELASGAWVTLGISGKVLNLDPADREWLFDLIDLFKMHEKALPQAASRASSSGWSSSGR